MSGLIIAFLASKLRPYFPLKAESVARWGFMVILALIIIAAILGAGYGVRSCYVKRKIAETSARVEAAKIESVKAHDEVRQLEEKLGPTADEVQAAKEVAKEKDEQVLEAIREDSSTQSDDIKAAMQRFCSLYPNDSQCN